MAYVSQLERFYSTIGVILHIIFVAIPKDLYQWVSLKHKSVWGKTVVITGGASGIGRGLAELFAVNYGAKVAILDIDKLGALETVMNIKERGGEAHAWKCDISDTIETEDCAKKVEAHYGDVSIVVCNAAVLFLGRVLDLTTSQLQKSISVNIMGTLNTVRAFLRSMEKRNEGQIVVISSIAGFCGETNGVAYCPTKFAVRGILECVQMEMFDRGLDGIKTTTICPYFTRTPMILKLGMRPTSTLIPFMSTERCTREILDAILKEKTLAFVPQYISFTALLKDLLPFHVRTAGREYINCRYDAYKAGNDDINEIVITKENDWYEKLPAEIKYGEMTLYATILFLIYTWSTPVMTTAAISLFLLHVVTGICTLYLCDISKFSYSYTFRWFIQTLLFGVPSLFALLKCRKVCYDLSNRWQKQENCMTHQS